MGQQIRMRGPDGTVTTVDSDEMIGRERAVDVFQKNGAVVLGPGGGEVERPPSTNHPYMDIALGARAALATPVLYGGDLIRRGLGMERVIDTPQAQEWRTVPNSVAGMFGKFSGDALGYGKVLGAANTLGKAANLGRAGMLGTEAAVGAGMGGLQTEGDPTAIVAGAALPAALAARGRLPAGGLGRAGKMVTDAALGGATGYAISGGDPGMAAAGALGLPAVTGGRAAASTALQAAGRVAEGASEGGVGGAVAGFLRKAAPGSPWRMITQAVKPRTSQPDFEATLPNIVPTIKHVANTAGMPLETLDDIVKATDYAKKTVRAQFDDAIGDTSRMVDLTPLADEQLASIPTILKEEHPGVWRRAVARANAWRGKRVPLETAERYLEETNASLEAFYNKHQGGQRAALKADPAAAAKEAKARALRDVLYGDNPGYNTGARVLNRKYGQLMEFKETLLRRKTVAERQQPESLSEQIGNVRAVGMAAKGLYSLAHGNPMGLADLAGARAGSAAAKFMKEQQTTDALLRRAFAQIPGPARQPPVAGIGPGARPMGPAPDTSGPIPGNGPGQYPEPVSRPGQRALPPGPAATRTTVLEGEVLGQPDPSYARGVPATPAEVGPRPGQRQLGTSITADRQTALGPGADPSRVRGIPADIEGGTPYADFEQAFNEEMRNVRDVTPDRPYRAGGGGGSTAAAIVGPLAGQAIPDDPESQWDDYGRLALNLAGAAGALGMAARTFDPKLKVELDHQQVLAKQKQKADYIKAGGNENDFKVHDSGVETHIRNYLRRKTGSKREADRLINQYETIALPIDEKTGIDYDDRRTLDQVLADDEVGTSRTTTDRTARGVKFSEFTQKRMDRAYEAGVERAKTEGWGDPRYLYHLTDGDPKAAVMLARLFGAFSPGQKTDANTLQGVEAFIRSMRGETAEQILGKKVPDPGRPGKMMRVGGSMSFKHVRPSTVEANLQRAVLLGRLFQEKVEALSAAEVGIKNKIPIDMWLLRALGAESDVTPSTKWYRLISEAVTKEAVKRGESPFGYMAKTWMGMQDIAGANTPSFQASTSKIRLPGPVTQEWVQQAFIDDPEKYGAAIRNKAMSDVGEVSPISTRPKMSYEAFEPALEQEFLAGTDRDVLGRETVVQNPANVTLADMQRMAQAAEMADALEGKPRTTRGPGKLMLLPDGSTQWYPFPGYVEKSGNPRAYKTPKGAVVVKEYKPKNAPKKGQADE